MHLENALLSSIMPTGVCSETEEGDIDSEYDGFGVSSVVGGTRYFVTEFVGVDLGEDA
jgi:hypothetical protein